MPTWGEILVEFQSSNPDQVRRKYLVALSQKTGRATILYATKWTQHSPNLSPNQVSINDEDLQGLMEVMHGISLPNLDLILHSPGGSLEAAESFVIYLRSKFDHIRVIVPQLAMSAATMIACAADEIVLGKHSFLGPIDPQFVLNTPMGQRMVPAQAIQEQFEIAQKECNDPTKLGAWIPMLGQYGPDLLVQCKHSSTISKKLVKGWLESFMFQSDQKKKQKASKIANWLANHQYFKTHGRHIPRDDLRKKGLKIVNLEEDQEVQDLVLSVFHATMMTLTVTAAVKIIENHLGKAFIQQAQMITLSNPIQVPAQPQNPVAPTNP